MSETENWETGSNRLNLAWKIGLKIEGYHKKKPELKTKNWSWKVVSK